MHLIKGHGTENDFLVLPDLDGAFDLTPETVRAWCDRHAGIGADGVLRVVRSENHPDGKPMSADAEFFMDYRNADGSLAEMCGNGVRVFVRYLHEVGLIGETTSVATRGGVKPARLLLNGDVSVDMGVPVLHDDTPTVTAEPVSRPGRHVSMPNPHVVVEIDSADDLNALELTHPPMVVPPLPHGQNVEFVLRLTDRHLQMRVHERGVGETRSCGTGICAAVVAADGATADGTRWRVDVPGGTCTVTWRTDGGVELAGPAFLVATIEIGS